MSRGRATMKIDHWRPRYNPGWQRTSDGAIKGNSWEEEGVVEIFTYPGCERHSAFTTLEMWIAPHFYKARFDRAYHRRWLWRLARSFAFQCGQIAKQRSAS